MDWLLVGLAADFSVLNPSGWWAMAQVVIGLGFVIFVHELGHFLLAKACGVKCEKFYVGFDAFDFKIGDRVLIPRALLKWKSGETEYGIGILPLGGYVKMLGQDDNPANLEKENQRARVDGSDQAPGPIDRSQLDPRSYLAKSVPQRMAIISAGVIFNLIFGVIFAALAFRFSVDYQPPVVSEPLPGGPAWVANMPEARITRVGQSSMEADYVTFGDMVQEVALQGTDGPVEIEYVPAGSNDRRTITLEAKAGLLPGLDIRLVGLGQPPMTCRLDNETPTFPTHAADRAQPAFQPNDEILSINGQKISRMSEFKRAIVSLFDEPIKVQVKRSESDTAVEILVDPNQARTLGFWGAWKPIEAVRESSPAHKAGLRTGDRILKVNGEEPGNLYTFDQRMIQWLRKGTTSVTLEVASTDKNGQASPSRQVQVELEMPNRISEPSGGWTALESIGVALNVESKVAGLETDGPAKKAGMKIGDRLISGSWKLPEEFKNNPNFGRNQLNFTIGSGKRELPVGSLFANLQELPPGTSFELVVESGNELAKPLAMNLELSRTDFRATRGIRLTALEETYTAQTWPEAFRVGARQVWNDSTRILRFLQKLVRGQISATNLGGPGTIAAVATSEATAGTARLLLFLTMLSANLAIVNFLPIPVLDGGHMLFLAYEGIFRRPVTERIQVILTWIGFLFIVGLMLFVIFLDVDRFRTWFL